MKLFYRFSLALTLVSVLFGIASGSMFDDVLGSMLNSAVNSANDERFVNLCIKGSVKEVRDELLKGANPNARNNVGETALMYAARNRDPEVISLLLKAGADVNAKSAIGSATALRYATSNPNPKAVSILLAAGSDVNAKDGLTGQTVLIGAATQNQNPEVFSVLLKAGADIHVKDINGMTALDYARKNGFKAVVDVLEGAVQESAQSGDPETLYQLGIKYVTGDGVKEDQKKGLDLLRRAAEQGHQKAKDALKLFSESELTEKKDKVASDKKNNTVSSSKIVRSDVPFGKDEKRKANIEMITEAYISLKDKILFLYDSMGYATNYYGNIDVAVPEGGTVDGYCFINKKNEMHIFIEDKKGNVTTSVVNLEHNDNSSMENNWFRLTIYNEFDFNVEEYIEDY